MSITDWLLISSPTCVDRSGIVSWPPDSKTRFVISTWQDGGTLKPRSKSRWSTLYTQEDASLLAHLKVCHDEAGVSAEKARPDFPGPSHECVAVGHHKVVHHEVVGQLQDVADEPVGQEGTCERCRERNDNEHAGCPICPLTWVGLTLIWVLHHLAQLYSRFCKIIINPGITGQTVEQLKSKSNRSHSR